jgi:glucose dehydrogenase
MPEEVNRADNGDTRRAGLVDEHRKGDNLYANSVVALDADTGKLRWYFQFTPHDLHDWDAAQIPVLVDVTLGDARHKALAWPNRNGFYYLRFNTGGRIVAAPVTYEVSGRQYVAVAAGHDILAFALASFDAGQ